MQLKLIQNALAELGRRLPANSDAAPRLAMLKGRAGHAQTIIGQVIGHADALSSDAGLSALGRRDKLRERIGSVALDIARLSATVRIAGDALNRWQKRNETVPALKETDAVGASKQVEYRAISRGMKSPAERLGAAIADPEFMISLLSGSNLASGLNSETRARLVEHYVASDPDRRAAAAQIADARIALGVLSATVDLTRDAMTTAGEFDAREWSSFFHAAIGNRAATIEADATRAVEALSL